MEAQGGSFPRGCGRKRRRRGARSARVEDTSWIAAPQLAPAWPTAKRPQHAASESRRGFLLRCVTYHRVRLLAAAKLGLPLEDVIPGQWNRFLTFSELELHDHVAVDAERSFRASEIEFPHAAEALVVKLRGFISTRHKPLAPNAQRLGIVQPQDFNVRDVKAGPLDRWQHFGQAGNVAAGEDIFADPGVGHARNGVAADGMEQHHSIVVEQSVDFGEEFVVPAGADVLEHSDRDDAIEGFTDIAIVLQPEVDPVGETHLASATGRDGELLLG